MSDHWGLAFRYAVWICVLAAPSGAGIWYFFGGGHAGAFLYGVGAATISSISAAPTTSLLTAHSGLWRALGIASFAVRYCFVAVALVVPAYLGLWPVFAMLAGFAGVYLAENVLLLPQVILLAKSGAVESKVHEEKQKVGV